MAMTLVSPLRSRERILLFGGAGTGKSHAAATVAKRIPTATFHVLDNDNAWDRLMDTDFTGLGNVEVEQAWDWTTELAWVERTSQTMDRDDWLVVDIFGDTWQHVQDWFALNVHGQDLGDYFLSVRKTLAANDTNLSAFDGWVDWSVINAQYVKLKNAILRARGHVLCTAGIDKYVAKASDDPSVAALFAGGWKPRGQKSIGHWFSTLVVMQQRTKEWQMTTAKDRGREMVDRLPWTDFATDYMMKVAGWKLATA